MSTDPYPPLFIRKENSSLDPVPISSGLARYSCCVVSMTAQLIEDRHAHAQRDQASHSGRSRRPHLLPFRPPISTPARESPAEARSRSTGAPPPYLGSCRRRPNQWCRGVDWMGPDGWSLGQPASERAGRSVACGLRRASWQLAIPLQSKCACPSARTGGYLIGLGRAFPLISVSMQWGHQPAADMLNPDECRALPAWCEVAG